eukprot:8598483-Pyramimonas_sp.AAC.1
MYVYVGAGAAVGGRVGGGRRDCGGAGEPDAEQGGAGLGARGGRSDAAVEAEEKAAAHRAHLLRPGGRNLPLRTRA